MKKEGGWCEQTERGLSGAKRTILISRLGTGGTGTLNFGRKTGRNRPGWGPGGTVWKTRTGKRGKLGQRPCGARNRVGPKRKTV